MITKSPLCRSWRPRMKDKNRNSARVIRNKYASARCCVCRGLIPVDELIYYEPEAAHGRRVRHLACVGISRELAGAKAAVAAAREAEAMAEVMIAEDDVRAAEAETAATVDEILDWVVGHLHGSYVREGLFRRLEDWRAAREVVRDRGTPASTDDVPESSEVGGKVIPFSRARRRFGAHQN